MASRHSATGTDNVLADLGFPDATELSAKAVLALRINQILGARRMNDAAAAARLGLPLSRLKALRQYKLRGLSLERLMRSLVALEQQVEIVVRRPQHRRAAGITATALR